MPRLNHLRQRSLLIAGCVVLASCHGGKPTGQVVAKVDGQEITATELRLELSQLGPGAADSPVAQQQALQALIGRKLLVREAAKQKLDDSPEARAAVANARDQALVELLQAKLRAQQPIDSSDMAINQFIVAHPSQFSNRKLITADQLTISSADPSLGTKLGAMPDLPAIEAYLSQNHVPFVRSAAVIDTAQLAAPAATKIVGMNPSTLYVAPVLDGTVRVMRIMSSQDAPLIGNDAHNFALRLMDADRGRVALDAARKIIAKGKSKVWIDPAFASS